MEQHSKFICKQLPVEIWRKILSHVDQFHLIKNVSRVSRLLYALSNSLITEVMVSDGRVFFGIKDSEHVGKCRGLSSIELASKFETFHKKYKYLNSIHLDKWDMLTKLALQLIDDLKKFDAHGIDLKEALKEGLIKTKNLTHVTLNNVPEIPEFLRCPKLESVIVRADFELFRNDSWFKYEDNIFEFLSWFVEKHRETIKILEIPSQCLTEHMVNILPDFQNLKRLALKIDNFIKIPKYVTEELQKGLLELSTPSLSNIHCLEFNFFGYGPVVKKILLNLEESLGTLIWDGPGADRVLKIALKMTNLKTLKVKFRGDSVKNKICNNTINVKCQLEVLHLVHFNMNKFMIYSLSNITTLKELRITANSHSQRKALEMLKTLVLFGSFQRLQRLTLQTCPGYCKKDSNAELQNPNDNFIELLMTVMNKCDNLSELRLPKQEGVGYPIEETFLTSFLDKLSGLTILEGTILDINLSADSKARLNSLMSI